MVWDGLVKASAKLGKSDSILSINTEKDDWRIKRLHMMAKLQATVLSEADGDADARSQDTLQSAKDFFTKWQTYPFCYDDIKDFVDNLSSTAQAEFSQHVSASPIRLTNPGEKQTIKAC
jgi:hypothetical protein